MNANVLLAGVMALAGIPARAAVAPPPPADFDRYGVILERRPFGEEGVPPPAAAPVVPPEQSFTTQLKMTAVTRDDQGVLRVGLVDLQDNRGAMVGVGDAFKGVTVVEADFIAERARLKRDPEDYWVSMTAGGTNRFEVTSGPAPTSETVSAPSLTDPAPARMADQQRSYAVRRLGREEARLRREIERLRAAEARREAGTAGATQAVASVRAGAKAGPGTGDAGQKLLALLGQSDTLELSPEELNQLLQEYQKDLIRSGQTPLPIPLTPETDRQLVEEGVLPAQE